jgi:hypothetical protein
MSPQCLASTLQYLQAKRVCCQEKWSIKFNPANSIWWSWWLEHVKCELSGDRPGIIIQQNRKAGGAVWFLTQHSSHAWYELCKLMELRNTTISNQNSGQSSHLTSVEVTFEPFTSSQYMPTILSSCCKLRAWTNSLMSTEYNVQRKWHKILDTANTYRANIIAYLFPCPYWFQRNYLIKERGRVHIWESVGFI